MILDKVVASLIDCEADGCYPVFWVATKPLIALELDLSHPTAEKEAFEWRKVL